MTDETLLTVYTDDDEHIDVEDFNDLRYWSNRFNVAKWRIKEAVLEVGDSAGAVEQHLGRGARPHRAPHRVVYLDARQPKRTY